MAHSKPARLLLVALSMALLLLAGPASAASEDIRSAPALDVDADPTFYQHRATLGFSATAAKGAIVNYQLGVARAEPCRTPSMGPDEWRPGPPRPPPGVLRFAAPPQAAIKVAAPQADSWAFAARSTPIGPSYESTEIRILQVRPLPPSPHGTDRALFCVGASHARPMPDVDVLRSAGVLLGPLRQQRLEAGIPTRLEAALNLAVLRDAAPDDELHNARFFVRVWEEGSQQPVVVPAGAQHTPTTVTAPAQHASHHAVNDATAALAAMALTCSTATASKTQRWKEWHLPLPWPLLWLFTRLHRSKLLDHKTRRLVHDLVEANPGIRFRALRDQSGLPTGVLTHHLRVLEDHDLVVTVRQGRHRHLYAKNAPRPAPAPLTERQRQILRLLETGDRSQADVAAMLGVSQQTVSYHLQRLRLVRQAAPFGRPRTQVA